MKLSVSWRACAAVLFISCAAQAADFTINGATVTFNTDLTIGTFTILSGSFTANSSSITVNGSWLVSGGAFSAGTSVITFGGTSSSQTITTMGYPFSGVKVTGPGGYYTLQDTTTISGGLTIGPGTLAFSRINSSSITMVGSNVTINPGGTLDMGTALDPIIGSSATLILAYGASDGQYGLLLNDGGNFLVNGAPKTPYAIAASSAGAGAQVVSVSAASAIGWSVGDVITIGGTELSAADQTEKRTITGVSAGDPKAISWSGGLSNNHYSTSTLVITNLSRNVLVRSSGTTVGAGGHGSSFTTLSTSATSFVLVEGEFAYLGGGGRINLGTVGSTAIRAFISSCTIREGAEIDPVGLINSTFTWSNFYFTSNGGMLLDTNSSNNVFSYNNSYSNQSGSGIELYQAGSGNQILYNYSYANTFGFGIYAWNNTTGGDLIQGNRVFANPYGGAGGALTIAIGNETVTGNIVYNNNNLGIYCTSANNVVITSNTIYNNLTGVTPGIKLQGCSNSLVSGNTLTNNGWGLALDNSSNFNTVSFNQASGSDINFYIGLSVSNISYGNRYFGATNGAESDGMYYDGGANQNTFIADQSYGNAQYGLELNTTTGNVCAGCALGFNGVTASSSALNEINIAVSPANLTLKNSVVNSTSGINTGSINLAGDYILSYNQDFATGTVKVYGDYTVSGTTFTVDYATQTYASSATTPKLMKGTGHSISSVVTIDGVTLNEIITATALDSGHWLISGSSSGVINASFACAAGSASCSFTSSKVNFTLATGVTTNAGDFVDFATLASGNDAGIAKKLYFAPVASALNTGRTKLTVAPGAGFHAVGISSGVTVLDMTPGGTYYSFVSSGSLTLAYASINDTDQDGLWVSSAPIISIASTTFDNAMVWASSAAYITISTQTGPRTFYNVNFANTPNRDKIFNIKTAAAASGWIWTMATYQGSRSGATYESDANNHIIWGTNVTCSSRTSVATFPWSNPGTWDYGVPTTCTPAFIVAGTTVTVDISSATASTTTISGTLYFSRSASSTMTVVGGNMTVASGGALDMGSSGDPISISSATLILAYGATGGQYGLTVNNGGDFTVYGAVKASTGALTTNAAANATSIQIATTGLGWGSGDLITVDTEAVTIGTLNSTSINFAGTQKVNIAHSSTTAIVTNLSRNVVVRSSGTLVPVYGGPNTSKNTAYIRNLATNTTSFSLAYGEFAYLGAYNVSGKYGITFDGANVKGSISSCTIHHTFDGLNSQSATGNTFSRNLLFGQTDSGLYWVGSSNNMIYGNWIYGNTSSNGNSMWISASSNDNIVDSNTAFLNLSDGIGVDSSVRNTLRNNVVYSHAYNGITNGLGMQVSGGSSGNSLLGNIVHHNTLYAIWVIDSNSNTFWGNQVSTNSNRGFYNTGSAANNLFVANQIYNNQQYGIEDAGSGGNRYIDNSIFNNITYDAYIEVPNTLFVDGDFGYPAATGIFRAQGAGVILKNVWANFPSNFYSGGDFTAAGTYVTVYSTQPGIVQVYGDYTVSGSTFTLDYANRLSTSTATAPLLNRGIGGVHTSSVTTTYDANAVSQLITITYNAGLTRWDVTGSSPTTALLCTISGAAGGTTDCPNNGTKQFNLTVTGSTPADGDFLSFGLMAASNDLITQKKLQFGFSNSFNKGRAKLSIASGAGFHAVGDPTAPSLITWLPSGGTYYTFVDSGTFTVAYSTITNTDENGIWLNGSGGVSMVNTVFNYSGNGTGSTSTYITAKAVISTTTFHGLEFDNARAHAFPYNVTVVGSDLSLSWTMQEYSGALAGNNYENNDLNDKIKWGYHEQSSGFWHVMD